MHVRVGEAQGGRPVVVEKLVVAAREGVGTTLFRTWVGIVRMTLVCRGMMSVGVECLRSDRQYVYCSDLVLPLTPQIYAAYEGVVTTSSPS